MSPAEASDGAVGEGGAGTGTVDLGGIEGEAGEGEPSQGDGGVAAPALPLEIPAFLELAELVVLDVPAGSVGLVGSEAGRPGAGADQGERWLRCRRVGRWRVGGWWVGRWRVGRDVTEEADPEGGIDPPPGPRLR